MGTAIVVFVAAALLGKRMIKVQGQIADKDEATLLSRTKIAQLSRQLPTAASKKVCALSRNFAA